ncbi:hypothetical protein CLU79DRAFT_772966 [Phycomyces nitens]|nr:hypothetical protein CLU79DRAFT_772966 [Phycomyces nitens]
MSTEPVIPHSQDLESLVHLETMFQECGYDDGFRDGELSGELEGRIFGCEKAFELGREIGFYEGAIKTWKHLAESYPDLISSKALRHMDRLQEQIDAFPNDNDPDTDLLAVRDKMKNKMRVITSLLGVQQKFLQTPITAMNY